MIKNIILYVGMFCLHGCLCITRLQYLSWPEEGVESPGTGVTVSCHVGVEIEQESFERVVNALDH